MNIKISKTKILADEYSKSESFYNFGYRERKKSDKGS